MKTYKLQKSNTSSAPDIVWCINSNTFISISVDNTDYQTFKREINADQAQLQDADGNLMSASAAKAFVATLP